MSLTAIIVIAFCIGYLFIALESVTKINKAAVALLMFVVVWTLYMVHPSLYLPGVPADKIAQTVSGIIERHLGSTSTTLFFLMGAMTVVEVVDQNGGFNWVKNVMHTRTKSGLLWRIAFMTFFLSAILDNLTSSIVMIMILRKLVSQHKDRMVYASLVIVAANAGGAFSPIGDVTTIMLWNANMITALGVISEIFIPSVIAIVIPGLILQTMLRGNLDNSGDGETVQMTRVRPSLNFCGRTRQWCPESPAVHFFGASAFQVFPPSNVTHVPSSIAAP